MSSLEEMETSGEDSMFFQDGLEVLEDGSTDDLIDAYVAPENYAQEGTPVREGKGGFTAVANGSSFQQQIYKTWLECGYPGLFMEQCRK